MTILNRITQLLFSRFKETFQPLWLAIILMAPLSGSSQTSYSPALDPALSAWFKADALNLTNNAPVSSWPPSGGAMTQPVVQTSARLRPVFKTNQLNGLPAVNFDGVATYLTNAGPSFPSVSAPVTIFMVYKFMGPLNGFQNCFIGSATNATPWWAGFYEGGIGAYEGGNVVKGPVSDQNWHIVMLVLAGANSKYRIDGGTDTALAGNPGTSALTSLEIGGQGGNAYSLANVSLGEILIYNGDQSGNEAAIFNYLDSRWTIIELEQFPPFTFNWPDRRPIGMDVLAGSLWSNPNNPRGWIGTNGPDYTSASGITALRTALLARADKEIAILTSINAQGVIFWDVEGQEIASLTYIGDPTKVSVLAPEMDAVADEFFAKYTSAGLRVGVTLRPHTFGAGTNLPATGTNGNVFVLTSAPFGQKTFYYTNGWVQTPQSTSTFPSSVTPSSYWPELSAKVQYAKNRWGCTLFYLDSFGGLDQYGPTSAATLTNLLQAYPGIFLAPEVANVASTAPKMFAMSAPYLEPKYTGYFVPTNVPPIYPQAVGLIKVDPPFTNGASLLASARAGNILLLNSWYPDNIDDLVSQAVAGAGVLPPSGLRIITNAP